MQTQDVTMKEGGNETANQSRIQGENVFHAVKTYKGQEEQLRSVANRIKKLQLNEIKNLQRVQNHQRLLSSLQKIRQEREEEMKMLRQNKEMHRSQVSAQQEKNAKEKSMNKLSIQKVISEIKIKKLQGYDWMKQKRIENDQKVVKIKELDLEEKKRVRDMIKYEEKSMKESRMTKLKLRKDNIEREKSQDIFEFKERGRVQEEQIKKLEKTETEMMWRHGQSKAKTLFVRQRSEMILRNQKTSLTEISRNQSVNNVYVHPLVKRIQKRIDKYHTLNQR